MNASRKRLKADLALGVRKLGPDSVTSKLGKYPLFDEIFPDLDDFQDLAGVSKRMGILIVRLKAIEI